jgi:hypothetical protein
MGVKKCLLGRYMKVSSVWIANVNTPANDQVNTDHGSELKNLAVSWSISEGDLRQRIAQLQSHVEGLSAVDHIALERLMGNSLTDEDRTHLATCEYCAVLQASVVPVDSHVEEFAEVAVRRTLEGSLRSRKKASPSIWLGIPAAAAILLAIVIGFPAYSDYVARARVSEGAFVDPILMRAEKDVGPMATGTFEQVRCGSAESDVSAREKKENQATFALMRIDFSNTERAQRELLAAARQYCAAGKPESAAGLAVAVMVADKNPTQAEAYVEAVRLNKKK